MFKNFFRKPQATVPNRPDIQLSLTFLGFESENAGIVVSWRATGAPPDIMFDLDFLGQPSGVTTGFLWDAEQDVLNNVFVMKGDSSFRFTAGWAYADNAMDGSGRVEAVWALDKVSSPELRFERGQQVTCDFAFDPKQKKVRNPN